MASSDRKRKGLPMKQFGAAMATALMLVVVAGGIAQAKGTQPIEANISGPGIPGGMQFTDADCCDEGSGDIQRLAEQTGLFAFVYGPECCDYSVQTGPLPKDLGPRYSLDW